MKVSVVIPVFNRADLLGQLLDGLSRQTMPLSGFEVLVCDDGSSEDIESKVREFENKFGSITYLRQENQGPAAARNLGVRNASCDLVHFLDSDVYPETNLLECMSEAMEQNPGWVGAETRIIPRGGIEDNPLWEGHSTASGGVYQTGAIIYRRDILRSIGGFDEAFRRAACEDVELAARAMQHGEIGFVGNTGVEHPRLRKTFHYYWKQRLDWRYMTYLALRHGFIGWPRNRTRHPRARILWSSLITLPAGRILISIRFLPRSPRDGAIAFSHAVFSLLCGILAIPDVLTARDPEQRDYISGLPAVDNPGYDPGT